MEVRRVEEVALDPPDLAVHLAPLGARIDVDLDRGLQRALAGVRAPSPTAATNHFLPCDEQHLRAVGGEQERAAARRRRRLPPSIFSSSFSVLRVFRSKRKTFCGGASLELGVVLVGEDDRVRDQEEHAFGARPRAPRSSRARWAARRCAGRGRRSRSSPARAASCPRPSSRRPSCRPACPLVFVVAAALLRVLRLGLSSLALSSAPSSSLSGATGEGRSLRSTAA